MATLREALLPAVNAVRAIPGDLGSYNNTLTIRTRTWSGGAVKLGTYTDSDVLVTPNPKIRETDGGEGMLVEYMTPSNAAGGLTYAQVNPAPTLTAGQEVLYIVTGDYGTRQYTSAHVDTSNPYHYTLHLSGLERTKPY